ncbi:methionyl-tRNA formyltransferase [Phaeobacter gallaeciensis]|uniref:Methionyl-tRNA formyltransferase n=1 Tax=Phaeobacter gallaeciensis TaxID=60890 RepID=A0AAD0EBF0_9RHOB|nr:methionyl-tRNA formyltransferase [Phaeobacter gallaeciensis]AHD08024.1 methionyl-tRNA formyltransferase [Phaeobacter gallaeciensis DSM 26640]ATE91290.1 methionyl-tRNA formyltransferase Fmt [Phaeobacter gallaeciensis]ATE95566.1 methionyl-tRNA formyltransferase Fmt [Phaeobacter gallaeciensis]ATE99905.1 methionyl-tRNA formyltransferase Fmt [Phaeobacter gallaeciensis]ATF04338.1 methionyl-tRNA formyltransferase Fmt [Phaeobacter gallaeciensis]
MRIVFMGTPDFSVPVLNALVEAGHDIAAVYCQPPRPAGRGKKDRPTPVHARADALGLAVRHPVSLKDAQQQAEFEALNADVAVVVAYGLILPQAVLDAPRQGCLNIHASLLPRWRGAAPIHRAIMAGDAQTGVCIMQMEAGLDTGPVLMREATDIGAEETTAQLHDRLSEMGADLIVRALTQLTELTPQVQPDDGVTYAHKIDKAEAHVDWTRPASEVDQQIRGLSPFPGAWCEIDGQRVKLLASRVVDGTGAAGKVLDDTLRVACGEGAVELLKLQRAGKGAQEREIFLRGFPVTAGTRL